MRRTTLVTGLAFWGVLCACSGSDPSEADIRENAGPGSGGGAPIDGEGGTGAAGGSAPDLSTNPWDKVDSGVFVHLFEWPWSDVALECEEFIGPAGFSAVQVSPPNEHALIEGRPWWERYQPVSYTLESRSGDEAAFVDMVQRCAAVGVDIYVDAVINHMSAQASGTGSAGTTFTKYQFGDTWAPEDFHSPACAIQQSDYQNDGQAVQTCELYGLADLDTSAEHVQEGLASYLLRLARLGVAGFRIDAAKHMAAADLAGIFSKVDAQTPRAPFVFLEVIDGVDEAVSSADYLDLTIGGEPVAITDFRYLGVGEMFRPPSEIGSLATFSPDAWNLLPPERAVVFTDNHDTQRSDSLSFLDGRSHQLANVFLLAYPFGYPKIMSSYSFVPGGGRDDGPPSTSDGTTLGPHNPNGQPCIIQGDRPFDADVTANLIEGRWVCEHRDPALTAMVAFRKATALAPIAHVWSQGPDTLAFAREGKGYVVINHTGEELTETLQTGLAEGVYCDVIVHGDPKTCSTDAAVTVGIDGQATISVGAHSAAAFYVTDET